MDAPIQIDVAALDSMHRRAFEDVLGRSLDPGQRLVVQVTPTPGNEAPAAAPKVIDLIKGFYEGMTDEEIEEIDQAIKVRANFTRPLP